VIVSTNSIRTLARHLDVPERTLRRAAAEGLVHGRRTSARRYETSLREEAYLRRQWPLLRDLRDALRTEPNVRLAVLFGSQATGEVVPGSDVDLLVRLGESSAARVAELTGRLERRLDRDVHLVRFQDAEQAASLMADALGHGRVLVDRERRWPALRSDQAGYRRRANAAAVPLETAMPDIDPA